jgi:hypothetical protein
MAMAVEDLDEAFRRGYRLAETSRSRSFGTGHAKPRCTRRSRRIPDASHTRRGLRGRARVGSLLRWGATA